MNKKYINIIYDLLLQQNIFQIPILKNIIKYKIYNYVKFFFYNYLLSSFSIFINTLKHATFLLNHKNKKNLKLSLYNKVWPINTFSIFNIGTHWICFNYIKTIKKKINVDMFDINDITEKNYKNIFNDHVIYNIKNYIISIMLLQKIVIVNIPSYSTINIPIGFFNKIYQKYSVISDAIYFHIGKHSNVSFYQTNNSLVESINSKIININIDEYSCLEYTNLQNDCLYTHNFYFLSVSQKSHSKFYFNNISLGGHVIFNYLNINQNHSYSEFNTQWLSIGKKQQKMYDIINMNHSGSNCISYEKFKGIYFDESGRILNNLVSIKDNTKNTKSYQLSENLIFSSNAYVKIFPAMEINSDNIKCTHGVVIDKLNANILFYICSRGLNSQVAKNIMIISFAKNIINQIKNKLIKISVWQHIKYQLEFLIK